MDSMQNREPEPEDMPEPKPRVKRTKGRAKGNTQSQSQKHKSAAHKKSKPLDVKTSITRLTDIAQSSNARFWNSHKIVHRNVAEDQNLTTFKGQNCRFSKAKPEHMKLVMKKRTKEDVEKHMKMLMKKRSMSDVKSRFYVSQIYEHG